MAKGNDIAAMEIDDSDQINNPKFSINGASLPFCMNGFFLCVCIDEFFLFWWGNFAVLQLLKSAQMQHGLRFGDYARYRCNSVAIAYAMW